MYRWLQLHLASGLTLAQGECSKALCYWVLMTGNLGNSPCLYQVQQQEKQLVELSGAWGMKVKLTNGTEYPPERMCITTGSVLTNNQPPSSVSGSLHADEEDYVAEVWEELDAVFQAQELHFDVQDDMNMSPVLGTPIPFNSTTAVVALHNAPATLTLPQQQQLVISLAAPDHPLPLLCHPILPP